MTFEAGSESTGAGNRQFEAGLRPHSVADQKLPEHAERLPQFLATRTAAVSHRYSWPSRKALLDLPTLRRPTA